MVWYLLDTADIQHKFIQRLKSHGDQHGALPQQGCMRLRWGWEQGGDSLVHSWDCARGYQSVHGSQGRLPRQSPSLSHATYGPLLHFSAGRSLIWFPLKTMKDFCWIQGIQTFILTASPEPSWPHLSSFSLQEVIPLGQEYQYPD